MKDYIAIIKSNELVAQGTYLMTLELTEACLEAQPGQFVMLRVASGTDPLLRRPFSIAGFDRNGALQILYRVVGKGTHLMSTWKQGMSTEVLGPLGRGFELPPTPHTSVMVAGGIGVAPLLFLLQRTSPLSTIVLMGARTGKELISIQGLIPKGIDMRVATEDGTRGQRGMVTDLVDSALNGLEPNKSTVYACGPQPMLKKISAICANRGFPCQVSIEAMMACGVGACQGCVVRAKGEERQYYHVCKDGPVFDIKEILWEEI